MQNILLLHGPNLNMLGQRDPFIYGNLSLLDLISITSEEAKKHNLNVISYQSNSEGQLIGYIQSIKSGICGILINAGALTHYSYALYDALVDCALPVVEVHLSDINNRENFRKKSVISPACIATISGKKEKSYLEGVNTLNKELQSKTLRRNNLI